MPDGINQYWRDGRFDLYICPRNSRPSSKGAPEHHNLRLVVTTNIQQALPRRSAGQRAIIIKCSSRPWSHSSPGYGQSVSRMTVCLCITALGVNVRFCRRQGRAPLVRPDLGRASWAVRSNSGSLETSGDDLREWTTVD
jgi:hypothetical protein